MVSPVFPARRTVENAEALAWLAAHPAGPGTSVITSLPDISEVPRKGFDGWRLWFVEAARRVIRWVPPDGVAIFYQSDIRHEGAWIDKSFLVMSAAAEEKATLLWHKIVCRKPPGTIGLGRSSYSHMLCFARTPRETPKRPGPDVLADAGAMSWNRGMGANACRVACRFLREETPTRIVVDPFCGEGAVLAAANAAGFDAIGVDLSVRRCRIALAQATLVAASLIAAPAFAERLPTLSVDVIDAVTDGVSPLIVAEITAVSAAKAGGELTVRNRRALRGKLALPPDVRQKLRAVLVHRSKTGPAKDRESPRDLLLSF